MSTEATPYRGGRTRAARVTAAVVIAVLAILGAACTTTPSGSKAAKVHADLVEGGFDLTWVAAASGAPYGYDVQYTVGEGGWLLAGSPMDPAFEFRGAAPKTSYQFRTRERVAPGESPNPYGSQLTVLYVEPDLPIVRINTAGHLPVVDKENYHNANMVIVPNGSSVPAYSGTMRIRGRGNSTWNLPKKPYKVKLDSKAGLMGMPSHKDWVLLANAMDKSQLRTWTAAEISERTDLAWTPKYRHVELILNGAYQGVYQLAEGVEVASNRVDITEMEDTDNAGEAVTGGFLMEIDDRLEENDEPGWRTDQNVPVVVKSPDPATPEQKLYLKAFVDDFESRLFGPDMADPVDGYASRIDVASAIDYWIVQELTRNGDSYWSSTFLTKGRSDDKLVFGPIWDHDRSMDSQVTDRPQPPEGWYARGRGMWNREMFKDPNFVDQVQARWAELAPTFTPLLTEIVDLGHELRNAISNDEVRWSYALAPTDQPEHLSNWLSTRIDWITNEFIAEG
jgi:hypothetical protein